MLKIKLATLKKYLRIYMIDEKKFDIIYLLNNNN